MVQFPRPSRREEQEFAGLISGLSGKEEQEVDGSISGTK